MTIAVNFKIEGLQGVLKTLQSLPPEVVSKRGGPVRAALRKAAVVIQKQEIENLRTIIATPNKDGTNKSSGLLEKNIVVTRGRLGGGINGERYLVRIRTKSYPVKGTSEKVVTSQIARLLEYGTEMRKPYPFIRPAFELKKQEATDTFVSELNKGIERILKKLEKQNGVEDK